MFIYARVSKCTSYFYAFLLITIRSGGWRAARPRKTALLRGPQRGGGSAVNN